MLTCGNIEANEMKDVEVVKALRIGGRNYINPKAAAKAWVEEAGRNIVNRHGRVTGAGLHGTAAHDRFSKAWHWWSYNCWKSMGKRQRYWRRVYPIMQKLLDA